MRMIKATPHDVSGKGFKKTYALALALALAGPSSSIAPSNDVKIVDPFWVRVDRILTGPNLS